MMLDEDEVKTLAQVARRLGAEGREEDIEAAFRSTLSLVRYLRSHEANKRLADDIHKKLNRLIAVQKQLKG